MSKNKKEDDGDELSERKGEDTSFPILPVQNPEMQAAQMHLELKAFSETLEMHLEYARLRAKVNWGLYQAMRDQGFSEQQAFAFVKEKGM